MTRVWMFPGQGSQSKGMGAELFDRYPDWTSDADAILGYSVRELCLDDPQSELGLTAFTQPALYVVSAMAARAERDDGQPAPDYVAGHSLGEYTALFAAGAFSFQDGLRLVQRRGELMGRVSGGGMAAIVGLAPAEIEHLLSESEAGRRVDIANFNSFDQTVVAGLVEDLAAIKPAFDARRARFIPLKVSAAFHSRYMEPPMREFAAFLDGIPVVPPSIPVVANVTGRPHDPAALKTTLARQIGSGVRWLDSMLFLLDQGATDFIEVGPGNVLTKLLQQIRKKREG